MAKESGESPMKAYLITTGFIFAVITAMHVWRATAEGGLLKPLWIGLILLPAALSIWAFALLRNSSRS